LRVFENRVLRRIFRPKREKVTGGWRKLHNELYNLYCIPNNIRGGRIKEDEIGVACCMHRRDEKCVQNFDQNT